MKTAKIKEALTTLPENTVIPLEDRLSLGNTVLNLAVSGEPDWGIAKGMYLWLVGDSSTGKTWIGMQVAAEASINPNFTGYKVYFDNAENGAYMDVVKYFGPRLAEMIEPPPAHPKNKNITAGSSTKVEEFYFHLDAAIKIGKPFLYILDSMDSLEGEEDEEKFLEVLGAQGTAKEDKVSGSYGTAVAKANSKNIKRYMSQLKEVGGILIVINQTRDNIQTNSYLAKFAPKTKPGQGGKALRFYAHCQLWTTCKGMMKRTVLGKEREYGFWVGVDVQKNRVSGWEGKVELAFLRKHGLDEVGTCVDYLTEEKYWKQEDKSGLIDAKELGKKLKREDLIKAIEQAGKEGALKKLVAKLWKKIDEEVVLKRKNPYNV